MSLSILGLHHVTAIATDAQTNLDFYAGLLGLRLVKKTVNFDDPGTYHLYYGDELGRPGTILTFFPWAGARRGSRGAGQATVTGLLVPEGSLGYWRQRLGGAGVPHDEPAVRFDEEVLTFLDPDGLKLELVARAGVGEVAPWADGPVPAQHGVRGFSGVTLAVADPEPTAAVLTDGMGLVRRDESVGRLRLAAAPGGESPALGPHVDLVATAEAGRVAAGTVHHVAFRTAGDEEELALAARVAERGLRPTQLIDRQYFHSVYFREPGGVLFELATDPPGFGFDEAPEELGSALRLPPWLESSREQIEAALPPLTEPAGQAAAEVAP